MRKCFNEAVEKFYPCICMGVCKWVVCKCVLLHRFSRVPLFVTPWAVTHQTPLSWDSPGKNTEWFAILSSKGSFQLRDRTHFSCIGRGFFTTNTTCEALVYVYVQINSKNLQDF